jgi:hypothetical protein
LGERPGWYDIGLSRNGKEPIEIIWRAGSDPTNSAILHAKIGDTGIISLSRWGRLERVKLPNLNKEKPSVIGTAREVLWQHPR